MKRSALALAALLALPFASQAADLSYSYLEADYVHVDPDNFDNANGYALRGSGAINENFNVIAGWTKINHDAPFGDQKAWYLGFGYHVPVADNTDLFTELAYNKETTFDNDGASARVGVRSALSPRFEGAAFVVPEARPRRGEPRARRVGPVQDHADVRHQCGSRARQQRQDHPGRSAPELLIALASAATKRKPGNAGLFCFLLMYNDYAGRTSTESARGTRASARARATAAGPRSA